MFCTKEIMKVLAIQVSLYSSINQQEFSVVEVRVVQVEIEYK